MLSNVVCKKASQSVLVVVQSCRGWQLTCTEVKPKHLRTMLEKFPVAEFET